jgi:O-6-methylguanine DNA methyltransferase
MVRRLVAPGLGDARALRADLRSLGAVTAPASLLPTALARTGLSDSYVCIQTPIGRLFVAFNVAGVSAVMRASDADEFEARFSRRFGRPVLPAPGAPTAVVAALRGERSKLSFDLRGLSEFERSVLNKALEIPRGEVRSYQWVAREIGRPLAVRAVGSALGRNPVPLLIPCHRVVRTDGRIGDYALGSASKRAILTEEGLDLERLEQMARSGVRYFGSATTRVFCVPTCRSARQIRDANCRVFRSGDQALSAGFRPCRVCRPVANARGA